MTAAIPFTDPDVRSVLYLDARRLLTRTHVLQRAKVAGPVNKVIVTHAAALTGHIQTPAITDVGCSHGSNKASRIPGGRCRRNNTRCWRRNLAWCRSRARRRRSATGTGHRW
jgi:hypothetical protein